MTYMHQSDRIISNMAPNHTNTDRDQLPASPSESQSNSAHEILTWAVKIPNNTKNYSAQKLSSKEK